MRRDIFPWALPKVSRARHSESVLCSRNLAFSLDAGKSRFLASLGMTSQRVLRLATQRILCAGLVLGLAGCGYHTAGHFSTMPKNVRVIAVPAMENKTSTYRVEQKLTAATIHEFLAKTKYRVVSDRNGGGGGFAGEGVRVGGGAVLFPTTNTATTNNAPAAAVAGTRTAGGAVAGRGAGKGVFSQPRFWVPQ